MMYSPLQQPITSTTAAPTMTAINVVFVRFLAGGGPYGGGGRGPDAPVTGAPETGGTRAVPHGSSGGPDAGGGYGGGCGGYDMRASLAKSM